jgi:Zn-dependent peptidase ImmA (M78 family)
VPVEEWARRLDIEEIAPLETQRFEGGFLTDENRSRGIILVNKEASEGRRRFTIGHELGHFLIMSHKPERTSAPALSGSIFRLDRFPISTI